MNDTPKVMIPIYFHRNCNKYNKYINTVRYSKYSHTKTLFFPIATTTDCIFCDEQEVVQGHLKCSVSCTFLSPLLVIHNLIVLTFTVWFP